MTQHGRQKGAVNGLLAAQILDGEGNARSVGWTEVRAWQPGSGTIWVHLDSKGVESRRWLHDKSGLDGIVVKALLADASRPSLIPLANGLLINLRGVNTNPDAEPEDMVWVQMWVEDERIVTSRYRHIAAVQDVREALADKSLRGPRNVGDVVIRLADRLLDRLGPVIGHLEESMDQLEWSAATGSRREQRRDLADLRRRTNMLRRWVGPQRDVITQLAADRSPLFDEGQRVRLSDGANRITHYLEDLVDLRARASDKHDEISQDQSEDMNRMMFVLSVAAAIFLPLALLTELVGLDFEGIAGREQSLTYLAFLAFLIAVGIGLAMLFWRLRGRFL